MIKNQKSALWTVLVIVLILYLLPFYYAKLFAWHCAEDYGGSNSLIYGSFSLSRMFLDAFDSYLNWGGRYICYASGQIGQWVLFHPAAYPVICMIVGLMAFVPILGLSQELGFQKSFRERLFWALLFFSAAYSSLPGLEQTFYWFSNIFTASLGSVFLLYEIWLACRLWNREKLSLPTLSGVMMAAFIAPGFYEHTAIAQFYFAVTLLLCSWWMKRHCKMFTWLCAWIILWVAVMMLAPGNMQRHEIQQAANSMLESMFMSGRALAGIGFHTIFSPWLLVIPAFIAGYASQANSISLLLSTKRRIILCLVVLCAPLTIAVLHVLARYPIAFNGRTGDSLLIISWIGLVWISVLFSGALGPAIKRFKIAPYLPAIAVFALLITGNSWGLWKNIFNGSLKIYAEEMQARHDAYRNGKDRDIVVYPLSVNAWPAQKLSLGDMSYITSGGVNLGISNSFGLRSVRLGPSVSEVRAFMASHPEKLLTNECAPPTSGIDRVKMTLIQDVPAGFAKQEWLDVEITGTADGLDALRYLRLIIMSDRCFSPVLSYFAEIKSFPRLSATMAAAVYGSKQNHVNYDLKNPETPVERVKLDSGKWNWSLLVPVNGSLNGRSSELIFCSLDTVTYFCGYRNVRKPLK